MVETKIIVVCGSVKYINEIYILAKKLRKNGHIVTDLEMVPYPSTFDPVEKWANKKFYFNKIESANLILVYNKNGYIGLATAMEIQFALDDNRKRPVRFLYIPEKIECRALMASGYYNVSVDGGWLNV